MLNRGFTVDYHLDRCKTSKMIGQKQRSEIKKYKKRKIRKIKE